MPLPATCPRLELALAPQAIHRANSFRRPFTLPLPIAPLALGRRRWGDAGRHGWALRTGYSAVVRLKRDFFAWITLRADAFNRLQRFVPVAVE